MAIRLPLTTVLDKNDAGQTGATSLLGGVAYPFLLPQDCDNVVVKLSASVIAGGVSATFQTFDDGTWYDVARTSIVSNTGASVFGQAAGMANAEFLSIPVVGAGIATGVAGYPAAGSILSVATGAAPASSLGVRQVSGLPIMGQANRIFLRYTAAVSGTDLARVQVKVNSQSATA